MLSRSEQTRLDGIEIDLRRTSPALDRALDHGVFRGLPDQRRRSYTLQAWPVAALAGLGCGLIALGLGLPNVIPLILGFYVLPFSFLGLWLPLFRTPRHGRGCSRR